ncbi:DUF6488 family protein [Thiomicrorhabdus arctica]|uniref:DUF6488 family protein n=1 Tax=Thiomicrorhabdus arctica TaxID=131540 RepID=UPI00036EC45F|nr:DUF6488 family protein [Thiomicrorhabdus arctica]
MKNLITALFLSLFMVTPAMASGGHAHGPDGGHSQSHAPITSAEAINRASKKITQLVSAGVIDASWSGVKASSVEQKTFANAAEWVIAFKNDKIKDSAKQNLYVFFSLEGHYIAANYSGK